jgi:hypothetical protein
MVKIFSMTYSSGKKGQATDYATSVLGLEKYYMLYAHGQDLCKTMPPLCRTSTWPCWLACWGWNTMLYAHGQDICHNSELR